MKKVVVVLLILMLSLTMVACVNNGGGGGPTPGTKDYTVDITILGDLYDCGVDVNDYAPPAASYTTSVKTAQIAKLKQKQDDEKLDHNFAYENGEYTTNFDSALQEFNWVNQADDEKAEATTFTKIFIYSDVTEIINRMAAAAIPEATMVQLVEYLTREDVDNAPISYTAGTGSAIRDYEELNDLYDIYDDNDSDQNYLNLQYKRRKVMNEVFGDFATGGTSDVIAAAQAARLGIEILSYAQQVVANEMIPDYLDKTAIELDFEEYFKVELLDYDSLVYFYSFNESCNVSAANDYLLANVNYKVAAANKTTLATLYGYYYQYEKADYNVFNDAEFKEYQQMGLKDYFESDADAIKYAGYDRKHYAEAYRYSADFYQKYYKAHFAFQLKQEKFDINVYEIDPCSTGEKYATQMQKAFEEGRMQSNLLVSDVNWEYTGENANVIAYNAAAKTYYSIPEAQRNGDDSQTAAADIAQVKLQIVELQSQYYTVTHKSLSATDFANTLKYQIYSYSADYVREIQSRNKDKVLSNAKIDRLETKITKYDPTDDYDIIASFNEDIDEHKDDIGVDNAMLSNHAYFYIEHGDVSSQLTTAGNYDWVEIASEMKETIEYDYDTYHANHLKSLTGYNETVVVKFEDTLIKKKTVSDGDSNANATKEYDTDWMISRLMDNHENVLRHSAGMANVEYREIGNLTAVKLSNDYLSDEAYVVGDNIVQINPEVIRDAVSGSFVIADTSELTKFDKAFNYEASGYKEQSFDSDEDITIAKWDTATDKWIGIVPTHNVAVASTNANYNSQGTYLTFESSDNYVYQYFFDGWYLDSTLLIEAEEEDFNYDIRLFPKYIVIKTAK